MKIIATLLLTCFLTPAFAQSQAQARLDAAQAEYAAGRLDSALVHV